MNEIKGSSSSEAFDFQKLEMRIHSPISGVAAYHSAYPSRREFLTALGLSLASTVAPHDLLAYANDDLPFRVSLIRNADLLRFDVLSNGLKIIPPSLFHCDAKIAPTTPRSTPLLTVVFSPQHLLEQSVPEDTTGSILPKRGQLGAIQALPTSLVFRWPRSLKELLLSESELLKIFDFECVFSSGEKTADSCHLEPVTGVLLTPTRANGVSWKTSKRTTTKDFNVLWTLRLQSDNGPLRMWVSGWRAQRASFPVPLNDPDRSNIADTFSGNPPTCGQHGIVPAPQVDNLLFSSQGGWFDIKGSWDPVPGCGLADWSESTSHGRDHFVEVVYKMWCFPDGIPVLLVKQSTREFDRFGTGSEMGTGVGAYLKTRLLLRPMEQSRLTTTEDLFESPFTEVVLPTDTTYILDIDHVHGDRPGTPSNYVIGNVNDAQIDLGAIAFWPLVGGKPLKLRTSVRDHGGASHEILRDFLIVGNALVEQKPTGEIRLKQSTDEQKLDLAWESSSERKISMGSIAWAIAPQATTGDTSLTLDEIDVVRAAPRGASRPFYSRAHSLSALLDVSRSLAGSAVSTPLSYRSTFQPDPGAVRNGPTEVLDPVTRPDGAFVRVHGPDSIQMDIKTGAQQGLGALASPSVRIGGVGRKAGLLLGSPSLPPTPAISEVFPGNAMLLGAFAFKEILQPNARIPDWLFRSDFGPAGANANADEEPNVDGWLATLLWSTEELQSQVFFERGEHCKFGILAGIGAKRSTGQVVWTSEAKLTDFSIAFPSYQAPFLKVVFEDLHFTASAGVSPHVSCQIARVEFDGLLKLIDAIRTILHLPPDLKIDVTSEAIGVTYQIKKDDPIDVIGLTFSRLSIRTGMALSLKGEPLEVTLGLNRKDEPFHIASASGYGGGGFLAVHYARDLSFELGMEMGAIVMKDFAIAKGEASVMAGFYFGSAANDFTFEGYVRLHGCLSVLGIGGIDIMAYLGLRWSSKCSTTFQGECEVRITVSIGIFSVSRSFKATHSFGPDCGAISTFELPARELSLEAFCESCP